MEPEEILNRNGPFLIRDVLAGGRRNDIFIDGTGTIAEIGTDIGRKYVGDAEFVIDGSHCLALPGLVNTHTHAAMTLLRGYADDMVLGDWLTKKIWPLEAHLTGDDVYWGTRLACLEMIRTGTTAFNDMYFFMEDAARAVDEAGIRAVLCHGFIDLGDPGKREVECKATESFVSFVKLMNNQRIRAATGPHAVYTVSPEGLRWCADFSKEEDIAIHIHLSETEKEVTDCISRYGKRPPALLEECGVLTPSTVAAHCCWLDEGDCRIVGKRLVNVSHNPSSNMKLATNRAMPYEMLGKSKANVCLGTDGCASNNNLDMFEEMKISALHQKFFWNDPTVLPAGEALRMATENGARALGFGPGTLKAGSPADIILVSTDAACNTPLHNPDSNLVYSCSGGSVVTTICNGRMLMHERKVLHEKEILEGASRAAESLVRRTLS
ncbi:MAG TPA: amidohydrolase family protein [Methanoregulaceae archaeon]|nr:amidohydrolase family protein [Methanoregulaceae archaeon]